MMLPVLETIAILNARRNKTASPSDYARPKTRGELRDLLASGTACEVASHVAEMTASMLEGWLGLSSFRVRPSENEGWSVFEAATNEDKGDKTV